MRESVPGKVQRTRQKLINAIREEVAETGSFSAELIARRAGISMATFYNQEDKVNYKSCLVMLV